MMKYIAFTLIIFCICSCDNGIKNRQKRTNNESFLIEKMIMNAKCVDSIEMIPPTVYADCDELVGCSLQQIKQIYGDYDLVFTSHWEMKSLNDDDPEYEFSRIFSESDLPVVITAYDWIRDQSIKDRLKYSIRDISVSDRMQDDEIVRDLKYKTIVDMINSDIDMGKCMRIFFVKYKNQEIAFDGAQLDCRSLLNHD